MNRPKNSSKSDSGRRGIRIVLGVVGLALVSAGMSHAAVTACNTSSTGLLITDASYGAAGTLGNGCRSVDLTFDNLTSTLGGTNIARIWATAGTINTVPNPDTITTTTLRVNGCTVTSGCNATNETTWDADDDGNPPASINGNFNFRALANNGFNPPGGSAYWVYSGLSIAAPGSLLNFDGNDVVSAVMTFCLGATSSVTAGSGGCVSGNVGAITITWDAAGTDDTTVSVSGLAAAVGVMSFTGTQNGIQGVSYNIPTALETFTSVYISTAFTINTIPTGAGTVGLIDFGYGFDQVATPEPSTFALLGSSLLGLGLLARRRRKS